MIKIPVAHLPNDVRVGDTAIVLRSGEDGLTMGEYRIATLGRRLADAEFVRRLCPDEGVCHHGCKPSQCFRVHNCGPLSVYGEDWTDADREHYADLDA